MKDKRAVVLGPPEPEVPLKNWKRTIDTDSDERLVEDGLDKLDTWFEYSQKLQVQITSLMVSLQSVQKNPEAKKETFRNLSARLRPLVALKETIDIFIFRGCENILDELDENGEEEDGE